MEAGEEEMFDMMKRKTAVTIIAGAMILIAMMFVSREISFAASKPARPVIISAEASDGIVTVKWKKAKRAKAYRVFVQSGKNKWKYMKTIRKTAKNKKKYIDTLRFKVRKAGKKYKIYRRAPEFKLAAKKLKARSFKQQAEAGATYSFAVQAISGKKKSKYSKIKTITVIDSSEQGDKTPEENKNAAHLITYHLNSGTNNPDNPSRYREGETVKLLEPVRDNYEFRGWFSDPDFKNQVTEIGADEAGDIELYAKWYIAPLNINGTGLEDMVWSWWYYPQIISDDSSGLKVFWGYSTGEGYCGVAKYDENSGRITKTALKMNKSPDDRNSLAVTFLDDKRLLCAYTGGFDENNEIHIRISDKALDISSFSENIVLESKGKTSYTQIIKAQGVYYLFYRVDSHDWACRMSQDAVSWSEEKLLVHSDAENYCRFMPTTDKGMIRMLMLSDPDAASSEIRMGFFNTNDNSIYNSDQVSRLGDVEISNTSFSVIKKPDSGQKLMLLDVTVTAPGKPEFLYSVSASRSNAEDGVYYLYDAGNQLEICECGKPLTNQGNQIGASFIDNKTLAVGRNSVGTDYIEIYKYNAEKVSMTKVLDEQAGISWSRNGHPMADANGKAVLWHNGFFDLKSEKDFDAGGRLYLLDKDKLVKADSPFMNGDVSGDAVSSNVSYVNKYIDDLFEKNMKPGTDYITQQFTWDRISKWSTNWVYYTGLVIEGFLQKDFDKYADSITEFYRQYIKEESDGRIKIRKFTSGELDAVMPVTGMVDLIKSGKLSEDDRALFEKAVNYAYGELEKQIIFPEAGNLWLHSQKSTGEPKKAWTKWNICLDGIYMSQIFLIHLTEAIDAGTIVVRDSSGKVVTSSEIWDDIYSRLSFVMNNFRSKETGLLYHGYCVKDKITNMAYWSRGMGWYTMVLLDAAEKIPDENRKKILTGYYQSLMKSIVEWQDPVTFLWYNVTDGREELAYRSHNGTSETAIYNIPESSGSAMFSYCLLRGYKIGLLTSEEYKTAGMKAFNSMAETKLNAKGLLDVYTSSSVTTDRNLYQRNDYTANDGKGVGPFIMASANIK